jgi:hypothetical protein
VDSARVLAKPLLNEKEHGKAKGVAAELSHSACTAPTEEARLVLAPLQAANVKPRKEKFLFACCVRDQIDITQRSVGIQWRGFREGG